MGRTYTTNFNLVKRDEGDIDWADDVNGNMDIIDAKIIDPESHAHLSLDLDRLKMNQAPYQFGTISFPNVTQADADATYGAAERDLINALKSRFNELVNALRTSTGCGVLRFETTTTTSSTTSSTSSSTTSSTSSSTSSTISTTSSTISTTSSTSSTISSTSSTSSTSSSTSSSTTTTTA